MRAVLARTIWIGVDVLNPITARGQPTLRLHRIDQHIATAIVGGVDKSSMLIYGHMARGAPFRRLCIQQAQ